MNKLYLHAMTIIFILLFCCGCISEQKTSNTNSAQQPWYRWWPNQKAPKAVVYTDFKNFEPVEHPTGKTLKSIPGVDPLGPEHILCQSIAGLTAKAVNEERLDEMLWIGMETNKDYVRWYSMIKDRLNLEERGTFKPWELVKRYHNKGIIQGYILYSYDFTSGGPTKFRDGSDESVNVATSLAGLYDAIIISEGQQARAESMGLKMLLDVRGKTENWCFDNYRNKLNRDYVLAQDPQMPHNRAIAIANKMMVIYGLDEPTESVYAWLNPLSSVIGWNGPDEGGFVSQMSRYGHINTASNWAINLAFGAAGSESWQVPKLKSIDPTKIEYDDGKHAVSFVMSDGSNVQWMIGSFCSSEYYWGNKDIGSLPIGFGTASACLTQVSPEAYTYLQQTQPDNVSVNLDEAGYYYIEMMGEARDDTTREELITLHAKRINHYVQKTGTSVFMLFTMDWDSPEAINSYKIFAREIDNISGMIVLQYYPYEAGDGKIIWVKDRHGIDIPVVSAKFALWANLDQERAGTPAKVARLINNSANQAESQNNKLQAWTVIHAWSGFKKTEGVDETAENAKYAETGTMAGVTPTQWCVDRLNNNIKTVTPDELLWRIRMQHNPKQTKSVIGID